MRKTLLALAALLAFSPALAQGPSGGGPGPAPAPSPWLVNGNTISYPGAVLTSPATPGGSKGPGTYNITGGYYVNGVLVSGLPPTMANGMICNPTGTLAVPVACTWNTFASGAIGTVANSMPFYTGGSWGRVTTGKSVVAPGSGALEGALPPQTATGASKAFVAADLYTYVRRSNGTSAMADTFPGTTTVGLVNGTRITYSNLNTTGNAVITAGAGTTMSGGGASDTVGPGRTVAYTYNSATTQWHAVDNTLNALLGPNNLSDVADVPTARTNLGLGSAALQNIGTSGATVPLLSTANTWTLAQTFPNGSIPNVTLANSSITINGQSVALGGSITVTATAAAITVGSTAVNGGAGILWNATAGSNLATITLNNNSVIATNGSGVPSATTTLPSGLTIPSPLGIVKGDVGLGNVANVDTTNASNISSGTLAGARLPTPTTTVLGGVLSATCTTSQWMRTISTAGAPGCSQPNFTDLAGSIAAAQIPSATITNAMMANMNAGTVRANPAGVAGVPQNVTGAVARTSAVLNIDQMSTQGNADTTIAATTRTIATTTSFTAPRTWTLPAANSVNPGQIIVVLDQAGAINGANVLTISRAGSDTINGSSAAGITTQYGGLMAWSDGVSKWTSLSGGGGGGTGVTSVATSGLATGGPIISSGTINVPSATKADQQAGSSTTTAVTPAQQQSHPSATKVYASILANGTCAACYNATTSGSGGNYLVTFGVPFTTTNYVCNVTPFSNTAIVTAQMVAKATGTISVQSVSGGVATAVTNLDVSCYGTQ